MGSSADRDPVEMLAEEYLERRRRGETPSIAEYADKYPDLAEEICDVFPALELMEDADPGTEDFTSATADTVADKELPRPERVGDYRILREIGRGAMGVVYEAEQESLGRRVALKVLPKHVSTGEKALVRFRREARAAARLHHTNIVPVFEVGQDGDTAFYAMQFIQGHSLDQVLAELRQLRLGNELGAPSSRGNDARTAALSMRRGQFEDSTNTPTDSDAELKSVEALPEAGRSTSESLSGSLSNRQDVYFRCVAQVGEQVAAALGYAHERGVVHRDIKPSNLLLDASGVVWVADFGLAKFEDDGHTRTGDIVGTLRYMSPERFRGTCDVGCGVNTAFANEVVPLRGRGIVLFDVVNVGERELLEVLDLLRYNRPTTRQKGNEEY